MKQKKNRLAGRAARIEKFWAARLKGLTGVERAERAWDYFRAQAKELPDDVRQKLYEKAAHDLVNMVDQAVHKFTSGKDVNRSKAQRAQTRAGAHARDPL